MSRAGYARTKDGIHIAYREWGDKEPAHVFLSEWAATVDTRDMHPAFIRLWRQLLGAISRVVSLAIALTPTATNCRTEGKSTSSIPTRSRRTPTAMAQAVLRDAA